MITRLLASLPCELFLLLLFLLGAAAGFVFACWWLTSTRAPAYKRGYQAGRDYKPGNYAWKVHFQGIDMINEGRAAEARADEKLLRSKLLIAAQLPPYLHDLTPTLTTCSPTKPLTPTTTAADLLLAAMRRTT